MGRRSVRLEDERRWIFNRLASAYRLRPGYPDTLIEALAALLPPGGRVVDLGAGTGHLAVPLAARGHFVEAVEPARAMREALARADAAGVRIVAGTAEESTLADACCDLAVVADAIHWIDPELAGREVRRIVRRRGRLALVEPRLADTPFLRDLRALLERENPRSRGPVSDRGRQLLAQAAPRAPIDEAIFLQDLPVDGETFESILRSFSFVGPAPGERLRAILAEARAVAAAHGGARWSREIRLRIVRI